MCVYHYHNYVASVEIISIILTIATYKHEYTIPITILMLLQILYMQFLVIQYLCILLYFHKFYWTSSYRSSVVAS